jgi:hypothetical protein
MFYAQTEVFSSQRDTEPTLVYQQKHRSVHTETADMFKRVRKIAKNDNWLRHACPQGKTGLPLDDFNDVCYFSIFRKYVEHIQVSLKSDKNNGFFK